MNREIVYCLTLNIVYVTYFRESRTLRLSSLPGKYSLNYVSSTWAAMRHENKLSPYDHWRQRRGLDVDIARSDWWKG